MRVAKSVKPKMRVQKTEVLVYDQGYTYNEAGLTYNEINVAYAGLYNHDIVPIVASVKADLPKIKTITDFQNTLPVRILRRGQPMGLLLDLTYPTSEVVYL